MHPGTFTNNTFPIFSQFPKFFPNFWELKLGTYMFYGWTEAHHAV